MQELRANTQVIVVIGPFVDVGDGFTPETGITLGAADEAELLKHGSTSTVDISGNTWAAVTSVDGHYGLTLSTTDTNTEGMLTVVIQDDSVCLPVKHQFMVLSEAAWDSKYVAKDDGFMDVNIKTIGRADTQETEASNLEAACAAYSVTRGLSGTALPAAAADAAGGLPISDAGGLDLDAILADTNEVQISLAAGGLIESMVDDLQAEVDGIQADTEDIQTRLPAALVSGRMDSNVQATAAALTFNLTGSITGNLSGSVGSVTGAVGSVTGAVGSVTGAVGSVTGNVGGNVVGSVGSISGVTFPSNFSSFVISAAGIASANVKQVNGTTVDGAGTSGDPWGPV